MPYKDPSKQKAYQREWQRHSRHLSKGGSRVLHEPVNIKTAIGLLSVLAYLIREVLLSKEGDIYTKARTAGYLVSIGLRAVETADLEARLVDLEEKVFGGEK